MNLLFLAALVDSQGIPHAKANQDTLNIILNLVFITIGAIALLMIVIAGLRMITSGDQPDKVAEARRTIVYAAIGLALAGSAAAIVNVVLNFSS